MSGFNTKERNNNGEYEITFYTESRQDFERVQDLCRELIDHNKPVSIKGDLISREALKNKFISTISVGRLEFGDIINLIDNAPTVEVPENEVNCVLTMFGKCSYNKTGCSDCEIKDKIRKALSDRPQGEWIDRMADKGYVECPFCHKHITGGDLNFCVKCGADMRKRRMKLIIDIDEETYNRAKNEPSILCGMNDGLIYQSNMKEAIANGKPYNPTGYLTEAEKKICKMYLEDLDKTHTCNEYNLLMNLIDNAQAIDSPQGEWIRIENKVSEYETETHWECSECHNPDYRLGEAEFCSYCGADMRKGDAE